MREMAFWEKVALNKSRDTTRLTLSGSRISGCGCDNAESVPEVSINPTIIVVSKLTAFWLFPSFMFLPFLPPLVDVLG